VRDGVEVGVPEHEEREVCELKGLVRPRRITRRGGLHVEEHLLAHQAAVRLDTQHDGKSIVQQK
jgi:hypothetical protein